MIIKIYCTQLTGLNFKQFKRKSLKNNAMPTLQFARHARYLLLYRT